MKPNQMLNVKSIAGETSEVQKGKEGKSERVTTKMRGIRKQKNEKNESEGENNKRKVMKQSCFKKPKGGRKTGKWVILKELGNRG